MPLTTYFHISIEEYARCVGRTGRTDRKGSFTSFISREDWVMAKEQIEFLEEADQEVPDELHNMARRLKAIKLLNAIGLVKEGANAG